MDSSNIIESIYKLMSQDVTIGSIIDYISGGWFPANVTAFQRQSMMSLSSHFVLKHYTLYLREDDAARFEVNWQSLNSRHVLVSWARVPEYVRHICTHVTINVVDEKAPASHPGLTFNATFTDNTFRIPQLKTGNHFIVTVTYLRDIIMESGEVYELIVGRGKCCVRAMFSFDEVVSLGKLASDFVREHNNRKGLQPIDVFYRNKPNDYFDDIFKNFSGKMVPYMKDFNGDPGSPINGNILGLFFSGKVDPRTGQLPDYSPFGNVRLKIPAVQLVANMNLYFADFYCHYRQHYVTVVATRVNSPADIFCRSHLPLMNPYTNPFLQVLDNGVYTTVKICQRVLVELLYTEVVDINLRLKHGGELSQIRRLVGRGVSRLEGIVKNQYCNICSLYPPLKRPRDDDEQVPLNASSRQSEPSVAKKAVKKAKRKIPSAAATLQSTNSASNSNIKPSQAFGFKSTECGRPVIKSMSAVPTPSPSISEGLLEDKKFDSVMSDDVTVISSDIDITACKKSNVMPALEEGTTCLVASEAAYSNGKVATVSKDDTSSSPDSGQTKPVLPIIAEKDKQKDNVPICAVRGKTLSPGIRSLMESVARVCDDVDVLVSDVFSPTKSAKKDVNENYSKPFTCQVGHLSSSKRDLSVSRLLHVAEKANVKSAQPDTSESQDILDYGDLNMALKKIECDVAEGCSPSLALGKTTGEGILNRDRVRECLASSDGMGSDSSHVNCLKNVDDLSKIPSTIE